MEYLEKLKNKQNFNSRLNPEIITDIERLAELHFDITGEEIVSDKMLLETALDNALSKRKPVEVSKKQDLERIDFLEKEKEKLHNELEQLKNAHQVNTSMLEADLAELQHENARLQTATDLVNEATAEKTILLQRIASLENAQTQAQNQNTDDNTVVVRLNAFQKGLVDAYLQNAEIVRLFERANRGGKANGMQDLINTPDYNQNKANLLTTVFVGNAFGSQLKRIFSSTELNKAFNNWRAAHNA